MGNPATIESHKAAAELFDRTVDSYQRRAEVREFTYSSLIFARRREVVRSMINRLRGPGNAIDFGMGPAVFAGELIARGLNYVGIDISQGMVERAREMGLPNATFIQGDLQALDEYRNSANAVLAIGLLDYLEDPGDGLARLVACLKPGGTLIVSFRNRLAIPTILRNAAKTVWQAWFKRLGVRRNSAFVSQVHEHAFSARRDLIPLLSRLGIASFETTYCNFSPLFFSFPLPGPLWSFWMRMDRRFARPATRWSCSSGVLCGRRVE